MSEAAPMKTLLRQERLPDRNYDLYEGTDEAHIFAEGGGGGAFGPSISRLEFFRVSSLEMTESGQPLEMRERNLVLTMPTAQLVEFLSNSLKALKENKAPILNAVDEQTKKMLAALD